MKKIGKSEISRKGFAIKATISEMILLGEGGSGSKSFLGKRLQGRSFSN